MRRLLRGQLPAMVHWTGPFLQVWSSHSAPPTHLAEWEEQNMQTAPGEERLVQLSNAGNCPRGNLLIVNLTS